MQEKKYTEPEKEEARNTAIGCLSSVVRLFVNVISAAFLTPFVCYGLTTVLYLPAPWLGVFALLFALIMLVRPLVNAGKAEIRNTTP